MDRFNRAAFLAGSLAAAGVAAATRAGAAAPAETSTVPPEQLLGRLMAGNRRFLDNDFPPLNRMAEKREVLLETQHPYAAILSCSDSRVVPNFVFVQGMGDLFIARVAGNYPDDLVIGSLEYAVEHLGTRLIVVLGHQNCGAVKAVYSAIANNAPLPAHLSTIEQLIAPGIAATVHANGTPDEAIIANVRAAVARLKAAPPVISKGVQSDGVLVVGALYHLASGEVTLVH
ncbi:MAG TPA: carbonic anhydrase [Candidatus Cybelea sp.]|jgi:carbonic anhydrase|nr:carbonic anhydrase [Candidatus Cybelea sp.]